MGGHRADVCQRPGETCHPPVADAEIDEEIAALRQDRDQMMTFRDSDVRAAFPELSPADEFSYHCFVALSEPQSHTIAYRSDVTGENRVRVKYLDCGLRREGLMCELQVQHAYYLREPASYFSVGAGVDLGEALKVIDLYGRTGGDISDLNVVDQTVEGFVLRFGRRGCACHTERVVRVRSFLFWEWLDVDELATSVCA
jgi:hypothetical protein